MVEIKIKDETGRFIENWVLMMSDLHEWFVLMIAKYGIPSKKSKDELAWAR